MGLLPAIHQVNGPGHTILESTGPFVGREREIDRALEALAEHRLVTLTGANGVGKTRLAIEIARARSAPDGARFVELARARDPAMAAEVIAAQGSSDAPDSLVVIDGCEHMIETVVAEIGPLLETRSDLSVLATSREPLAGPGESVLGTPSLRTEEAAALFTERARRVGVTTAPDDPEVARVVRRLDGIPLAIELAAGQAEHMTVTRIADGLDSRFAALAGGRRGAVERPATVRLAIAWVHGLLSDQEQRLVERLAVLDWGWDASLAAAVAGFDPLGPDRTSELLDGLVRRFVVARSGGRYGMHESVRQYAEERLIRRVDDLDAVDARLQSLDT